MSNDPGKAGGPARNKTRPARREEARHHSKVHARRGGGLRGINPDDANTNIPIIQNRSNLKKRSFTPRRGTFDEGPLVKGPSGLAHRTAPRTELQVGRLGHTVL